MWGHHAAVCVCFPVLNVDEVTFPQVMQHLIVGTKGGRHVAFFFPPATAQESRFEGGGSGRPPSFLCSHEFRQQHRRLQHREVVSDGSTLREKSTSEQSQIRRSAILLVAPTRQLVFVATAGSKVMK